MSFPPRLKSSRADLSAALAEWRGLLLRPLNLTGGGLVRHALGPDGVTLSVREDGLRYVRLANSSNPYTGTEVYGTPGGGWTNLPGAPPLTQVYEDNNLTGLSGKVVRVRPSRGEWRFAYKRRGGCRVKIRAQGCQDGTPGTNYQPLPGASIAVSQGGSPVASGTTDAAGEFEFTAPAAGSYDVVATASRFLAYTGSVGLTCNTTTPVRLLPDTANYACSTICPYPLAKTLFFTVPLWGSGVLTYDSVTNTWISAKTTYSYSGCGIYSPACKAQTSEAIFRFGAVGGGFSIQYPAPLAPIDGSTWYKCPTAVLTGQNSQTLVAISRQNVVCPPGTFSAEYVFQDRDVFCGSPHVALLTE